MVFISFEDFLKLSIDEINLLKPVEILGFRGCGFIPDIYRALEDEKDAAIEKFVELILNSNITEITLRGFYALLDRGRQGSLFTPSRMNKIFDALKKSPSLTTLSLEIAANSFKSSYPKFCDMVQTSENLKKIHLTITSFEGGDNKEISFFEYLGNDNVDIFIKIFEKIEAFKLKINCFNPAWGLNNEQSIAFANGLKNCKELNLSGNRLFLWKSQEKFDNLMSMLEAMPVLKIFDILEHNCTDYLTDEQFSRLASFWSKKNKEREKLFISCDHPFSLDEECSPEKPRTLFKAMRSLSPKFFVFEFRFNKTPLINFENLGIFSGSSPNLRSIELKGSPVFSEENFSSFISEIKKSKTIFEIKLSADILKRLTTQQQEEILAICKRNRNEYQLSVIRGSLELLQETPDTKRILPLEIRLAILHMAFPDYPENRLKNMTEEGENFNKALLLREKRLSSNNGDDNNSNNSNNNNNNNNNNNSKK